MFRTWRKRERSRGQAVLCWQSLMPATRVESCTDSSNLLGVMSRWAESLWAREGLQMPPLATRQCCKCWFGDREQLRLLGHSAVHKGQEFLDAPFRLSQATGSPSSSWSQADTQSCSKVPFNWGWLGGPSPSPYQTRSGKSSHQHKSSGHVALT